MTQKSWFTVTHPLFISFIASYSTGVQVVSCTLSDDSVLSESTGLFNPVLCVSQWNLFWQKNQPMRLCLSNQVRPGREWFPSPLGDFNRLFEGLIGELFKVWPWNMFYFFKWHQSGPLNVNLYHCCAGKASWMHCPLHNQKVNKPSFHGASCQLAPFNSLNTQSTVLTNSSVMVASVVYGEWRWQPY